MGILNKAGSLEDWSTPEPPTTSIIAAKVPAKFKQQIEGLARRKRLTVSKLITQALQRELDDEL